MMRRQENRAIVNNPVSELFVDGIYNIGFGNGIVRVDMFSLAVNMAEDSGDQVPIVRQRLVMSPQAFVAATKIMQGMVRQLQQAGVIPADGEPAALPIAVNGTPTAPPSPQGNVVRASPSSPGRSPNFGE